MKQYEKVLRSVHWRRQCLILFDAAQEDKSREVVQKFTTKFLATRAGLKVGATFGVINQDNISVLYAKLKKILFSPP